MIYLAGASAVTMLACFSPSPPVGLQCSETGKCPKGQTCDRGVCLLSEDVDGDGAPPGDGAAIDAPGCSTEWEFVTKLSSSGLSLGDNLGAAVALSADYAAAGVAKDDTIATDAGSVVIFNRNGADWQVGPTVSADDAGANDQFGTSVALSGDVLVVGAFLEQDLGVGAGAAYVFRNSSGTWTQEAKMTASDGGADHHLGDAVATDGQIVVAGAPQPLVGRGRLYAYSSMASWGQVESAGPGDFGDATASAFGDAVALSGDRIAVGATNGDAVPFAGSVFVAQWDGATWTADAQLTAPIPVRDDSFGASVALVGDLLVVGAPGDDNDNGTSAGSAFVFERVSGQWELRSHLISPTGEASDGFGRTVATDGQVIAVGAPLEDAVSADNAGAVHLFVRVGTEWIHTAAVRDQQSSTNGQFGSAVALSDNRLLVGIQLDDMVAVNGGAVAIYQSGCP